MSWTSPKTWTSEPLTSGDLNREVRDNLNALKDPPTVVVTPQEPADYSTTSLTFVDVDSDKLSVDITPSGDTVLVGFTGVARYSASARGYFDLAVNGTRVGGDDGIYGILWSAVTNQDLPVSFVWLVNTLTPGQQSTIALQWKTQTSGTLTLHANAGTTNREYQPQFWVREIS